MQVELPVRHRGECCDLTLELDTEVAGQTVEVLKALADPMRLQIVAILLRAQQPVCVCDLTPISELTQPTISHHMGKLKAAGLIESSKRGIWAYYRIRDDLAPQVRALVVAAVGST